MLRQRVRHLLLKCTNLGYGTVLTAACARQGCSTSDFFVMCHQKGSEELGKLKLIDRNQVFDVLLMFIRLGKTQYRYYKEHAATFLQARKEITAEVNID
jgi:hypothetical protein